MSASTRHRITVQVVGLVVCMGLSFAVGLAAMFGIGG